MKLEQYRWFDLIILSILALVAEEMGIWLYERFTTAGFYLNFSSLVALIALLRWGSRGAVVSCMAAVPVILMNHAVTLPLFLFYLISNGAVAIVPKLFRHLETSKIVSTSYWLLGYVLSFYGVFIVSRGLLGFLQGLTFQVTVIQTIAQLLFSMVMSFFVLLLIKNREGLLVDMTAYMENKQKEIKE